MWPDKSLGKRVLVRISDPNHLPLVYESPTSRWIRGHREIEHEARIYDTYLQALQGTVVPVFHGLWRARWNRGPIIGDTELYAMVLEDVGRTLAELPGVTIPVFCKAPEYHGRIAAAYEVLHSAGVVHDNRDLWNIGTRCPRTDDDDIPQRKDPSSVVLTSFVQAVGKRDDNSENSLADEKKWLPKAMTKRQAE